MLFIDTLLLSPIYGAIWAARQVHHAIEQERAAEPARITAELSELYMMLETRRITEARAAAMRQQRVCLRRKGHPRPCNQFLTPALRLGNRRAPDRLPARTT
jgi:hypothetical protein